MGYFFLISWTPTLMSAAHATPAIDIRPGAVVEPAGLVGAGQDPEAAVLTRGAVEDDHSSLPRTALGCA